jgi:hypothetical protein
LTAASDDDVKERRGLIVLPVLSEQKDTTRTQKEKKVFKKLKDVYLRHGVEHGFLPFHVILFANMLFDTFARFDQEEENSRLRVQNHFPCFHERIYNLSNMMFL